MVRNRDPFSTALESLRHRLAEGRYGDGAPIVIQYEAQRLRLSTTPVREALAWLCGAGLVERAPTAGYTASRLDAGAVRDWYGFRRDCLLLSLEALTAPSVGSALPEDLLACSTGSSDGAATACAPGLFVVSVFTSSGLRPLNITCLAIGRPPHAICSRPCRTIAWSG